jgi:alpha-N-arabinofuranosidase
LVKAVLPKSSRSIGGQILTSGKYTDINTFEQSAKVRLAAFTGAAINGNELTAALPPLSVVMLTIKE